MLNVNEYVGFIAPETFVQLAPPFVLTSHCTGGDPSAAAVSVTVLPGHTLFWLTGFCVMVGATDMFSAAGFVTAGGEHNPVTTQRY